MFCCLPSNWRMYLKNLATVYDLSLDEKKKINFHHSHTPSNIPSDWEDISP